MKQKIQLFDVVALTEDVLGTGLSRGQVGTVVDILGNGDAFEVEFCDKDGRMYDSLGLRPEQLIVLIYEPAFA
ncbi:MAG: DUF4926 domain-containing protein [Chloroflexi bacterium]|nr:MAG: DUF4926 domain-containing protein [Chloroflexota bacterium]